MDLLRVVVAVSRDRSDLYFANQLMRRLNVVGVIVENQVPDRDTTHPLHKAWRLIGKPYVLMNRVYEALFQRWRSKYALYAQQENQTDFGNEGLELFPPAHVNVVHTRGVNAINSPEYVEWLKSIKPDVVVVCGTSLLRSTFVSVPTRGVLNLHGGLAQRYRGLNTTDWCVHNGEPEYAGGTVHFVASGIDDGDIVYQGRPVIEPDDTPNTLYVKVVKIGVDMMEAAVKAMEAGVLKTAPLAARGDLYLGKQFTPAVWAKTWKRYSEGVIADYVAHKGERDAKVDQIIQNEFPHSAG